MRTTTEIFHSPTILIGSDYISVRPHADHEFTITTAEAAKGFGVDPSALRKNLQRHPDELVEGKHFSRVTDSHAGNRSELHWTKRGVIRLGFFIRSKRAKAFRDAAEDLILAHLQPQNAIDQVAASQDLAASNRELAAELRAMRLALTGQGSDVSDISDVSPTNVTGAITAEIRKHRPVDAVPKWLASIARNCLERGQCTTEFTVSELLAKEPPLARGVKSPSRALGRQMAKIARQPQRLDSKHIARWFPNRGAKERRWELEIRSLAPG